MIRKIIVYLALLLGVLFIASIVISAILTIVSIITTLIMIAVTVFVVGGLAYLAFAAANILSNSGDEQEVTKTPETQEERIDELKRQRLNGDISDDEFERLLELELDGPDENEVSYEFQTQ